MYIDLGYILTKNAFTCFFVCLSVQAVTRSSLIIKVIGSSSDEQNYSKVKVIWRSMLRSHNIKIKLTEIEEK